MFDLLKLALLGAGCIALYGIATGADLNDLFSETTKQIVPVAKDIFSGLIEIVKDAINSQS
jgi:hypothetical protein